jgi:hypothetical protein
MSSDSQTKSLEPEVRRAKTSSRFRAVVGTFEDALSRAVIDKLARWCEERFATDLRRRPSKHVYIRTLPKEIVQQVDHLRDSPLIRASLLRQFEEGSVVTPMKHTDELYISHYNRDFGGRRRRKQLYHVRHCVWK